MSENEVYRIGSTIYLNGEIRSESTNLLIKLSAELLEEETDKYTLMLNSTGGSSISTCQYIDFMNINFFGKKKYQCKCVANKYCMSNAICALCAFPDRQCYQHTVFRFHDLTTTVEDATHDQIMDERKMFDYLETVYKSIIKKATKLTIKEINYLMRKDSYTYSNEALKLGLVTKILGKKYV